ncbi:hypothetical protein CMI39_00305 [Candidatus Pacearchaeota archaeon]|jgi:rhodanese-related sulfurtransferase|nr:hypothetical protein [Candidatus Pacearchaeota archaeon]|tara:strand:+ start:5959 stop:6591 length:633 start_codon:yes stop_codon:yes gene_type:complete
MKKIYVFIIFASIFGFIFGSLGSFIILKSYNSQEKILSEDERIKEFYLTETSVLVSPHGLRKAMTKGDESFTLVDVRSEEEYIEEHIVGAINIPAYKDRDHSDYGAVERIVSSFKKLEKENPDKDIIVYCYSIPCMTGRKVGKILAENDIYVRELGVGWNEWRYFWTLWNHPHEWNNTYVEDYVTNGSLPGQLKEGLVSKSCPIEGSLGC